MKKPEKLERPEKLEKPLNYYGFAFDEPGEGYNKKFLKSKKGKKAIKKIKKKNKQFKKQLQKRGFDDTELWNLDTTIISFTLPRLKEFRKNIIGYPSQISEKKWKRILDNIIWSFEQYMKDDVLQEDYKKYIRGFKYFGKYLPNMWQ
jgi:hypothetical protein